LLCEIRILCPIKQKKDTTKHKKNNYKTHIEVIEHQIPGILDTKKMHTKVSTT